jgi:outer membrane receptor protein involved in Fe transport
MEARPVRIPGVNPRDGIIDQTDALPAAGFIFAATPTSNVRLAYGRTIARPTFKELTDIRYEDVFTLDTYVGNPELRLTKIDNVDLRWELFPRRGETIAVSAFYKRMRDPIEVVFRPQAGSIQPQNVERGEVYGVELEFRRRLDFLGQAFAPFSFGSNLALIASSVTIPAAEMASIRLQEPNARGKRELLGQSPYVFNADLTWQGRRTGSAATMSFNVVGPRLSLVQFGSIPDVYEQPAPMLNFVFTQRVWRGLRLKFSAKNLLDPDRKKTIGLIDRELIYERYRTGRTFSLSATYLFE